MELGGRLLGGTQNRHPRRWRGGMMVAQSRIGGGCQCGTVHDTRGDEPYADNAVGPSPWRLATRQDFDRIVAMNERLNTEDPGETMPFDGLMMRRTLSEITINPIGGASEGPL